VSALANPLPANGFERAGTVLWKERPELIPSVRRLRQAEVIELVRRRRDSADQTLGFASRPFVLCGLPIKRPMKDQILHERRNGRFLFK
jgi:hypothetical protein